MKQENDPAKKKEFLDAYKKVRKPTAPSERVIPDKRRKIEERENLRDVQDLKDLKDGSRSDPLNPSGRAAIANVRARVVVTGKVQGVFFRAQAQEHASAAGLTGWVRNRGDGSVELVLEGPKEDVRHVIDWCHAGPPAARVANVEVFWEQAKGEFTSFETKHTF